jgi:hypothetical protein
MQVRCRRVLAAIRAVDQKQGRSWKRGTEVVDQICEGGARAGFIAADLDRRVCSLAPCPTGMRSIPAA